MLEGNDRSDGRVGTVVTIALISVPFLVVDWLPMTDLPHHLAQAHLLRQALSGTHPELLVHWLSPNTLTTWVLAGLSIVFPTLLLAKVVVLSTLALSVLAVALLAEEIRASPPMIPLSAMLLFNQSFYWGFLPFMAGFLTFLFALLGMTRLVQGSWRQTTYMALLFLAVYFGHVLWLSVALLAAVLFALSSSNRAERLRSMLYSASPAILLAVLWYPSMHRDLTGRGFDLAPLWASTVLDRLTPNYAAFCLSGSESGLNLIVLLIIMLSVSIGLGRNIWGRARINSAPLLIVALALLVAYLVFPDRYDNTIMFSFRWLPYALIILLLACLAPLQIFGRQWPMVAAACLALAGYTLHTTMAWQGIDKDEMSGLTQALEELPVGQRVLGLDFVQRSARLNTPYPYAAVAAYAEPMKDCALNFSFAENPTSLVTYRVPPHRPYLADLNLVSQRVRRHDASFFDFILVNGDDATHSRVVGFLGATPITHEGRWRLYRVTK